MELQVCQMRNFPLSLGAFIPHPLHVCCGKAAATAVVNSRVPESATPASAALVATAVLALAVQRHRTGIGCSRQTRRRTIGRGIATLAVADPQTQQQVDARGLLLIEHLNLNVLSTEVALRFYEAIGCRRDARRPMKKTLHCNCGALTQFHVPSPANEVFIGESGAQIWRGNIELLYADSAAVSAAASRVRALKEDATLASTKLTVTEHNDSGDVFVTCPYGNVFSLRVADESRKAALGPVSGQRPGSSECEVVALGSVSLWVPPGTAKRGAHFYREVLGCGAAELGPGRWAVLGGPGGTSQQLVLEEKEGTTGEELGEHVAIYVEDFAMCFKRLLAAGLIWVNPRFVHLDNSTTLEEAEHYSCFRFKDIIDMESGEKLFGLEHEVRSIRHKSCALHAV